MSFLKMESNNDITLYLMQAVGSDPSAQPDLISSTMLSMGVPFQKASLAGWAAALPKRARANKHTTLLDTILLSSCDVHWTMVEMFVIVSTRTPCFLYSYFKFRTSPTVPVGIVFERTTLDVHIRPFNVERAQV